MVLSHLHITGYLTDYFWIAFQPGIRYNKKESCSSKAALSTCKEASERILPDSAE